MAGDGPAQVCVEAVVRPRLEPLRIVRGSARLDAGGHRLDLPGASEGREDQGDSPGAADFYYGEMEMRRHDPQSSPSERAILTAYWLSSGYALRGLRAALGLLAVVAIFSCIFYSVGFEQSIGAVHAVLFSAESTSSLFRIRRRRITTLPKLARQLSWLYG